MTETSSDDTPHELTEHEIRLKRLRIRCWRRGTKEMDLLFGQFADGALADLSEPDLDAFETLMNENDQDLYLWISGTTPVPDPLMPAVQMVREFHKIT
ncbi:MAG: succinate dehydrogenase assembly factor 2 [Pseudomonadota bacterium]